MRKGRKSPLEFESGDLDGTDISRFVARTALPLPTLESILFGNPLEAEITEPSHPRPSERSSKDDTPARDAIASANTSLSAKQPSPAASLQSTNSRSGVSSSRGTSKGRESSLLLPPERIASFREELNAAIQEGNEKSRSALESMPFSPVRALDGSSAVHYRCDVPNCGRVFSYKANMRRHQLRHRGLRFFSCPACSASFSRVDDLHTHARTHTGERPYSCDACDQRFVRVSDLRSHEKTAHPTKPRTCTNVSRGRKRTIPVDDIPPVEPKRAATTTSVSKRARPPSPTLTEQSSGSSSSSSSNLSQLSHPETTEKLKSYLRSALRSRN